MENFDWQLMVALICVAAAMWTMVARFRNLVAGKGGCGDCSKADPAVKDSTNPKLISEDQIEILYEERV